MVKALICNREREYFQHILVFHKSLCSSARVLINTQDNFITPLIQECQRRQAMYKSLMRLLKDSHQLAFDDFWVDLKVHQSNRSTYLLEKDWEPDPPPWHFYASFPLKGTFLELSFLNRDKLVICKANLFHILRALLSKLPFPKNW